MAEQKLRFKRETLGVSILLLLGSLFIIYPFLDAIILAAASAYLLRALHRKLNKKINNSLLSSLIITTSLTGITTLILFFFINNFHDIINIINNMAIDLQANIDHLVETFSLPETFRAEVIGFINSLSLSLQQYLQSTLSSIPIILIHTGIYLVTTIYLFKDGGIIKEKTMNVVNSLPDDEQKIIKTLITSTDSIFKGVFMTQFVVAGIIGLLSVIGLYLIGLATSPIPFVILWSAIIAIAALLPIIAGFMVYAPLGGYYLIFGEPIKGTLILLFGTVIVNILPEIFLRPYVGSKQLDEHPLIVFVGFLAGPLTMGLKGIILGPIMLILSKEFIQNYSQLVSSEPE